MLFRSPTYRDDTINVSILPSQLRRLALGPARWELPPAMSALLRELRLEAPLEQPTLLPFLTAESNQLISLHLAETPCSTAEIFEGSAFETLERLVLVDDLADDALEWLSRSPLLRKLTHLTVGGPFTDAGLDFVLRAFDRFSRLEQIVLWGGVISRELRAMARKQLPQMLLVKQAPPSTW